MPKPNKEEFGPWNPGLSSTIPKRLMPRVTLFDPRYSFVGWEEADALSHIIGLQPTELAVTRPERLALHSVLIRVTSQLYVPDGPNYADFGIALRNMAQEIFDGFVVPETDAVQAAYEEVRREATAVVEGLLTEHVFGPPAAPPPRPQGFLARLLSRPAPVAAPADPTQRALDIAVEWRDMRNEDMGSASKRAVARVLGGALNQRGRLVVEQETLAKVAVGLVMNRLGSAAIGKVVQDLFSKGAEALGYRSLPPQAEPVVLNAKGASASGKSSIRFAQRGIAERAGYDWRDFAIISPDYWRKALIDYNSLGPDSKYAAMMCGQELEVIDRKLDILMAVKGAEGTVPHMLIDRFRFDSFQPDGNRAGDSTLLTRFGAKVYLFFLVTPPAATVERAWTRGLETGRYKAVDDLLFHNVEAYTGMPDLFFRWAMGRDKWVQYEFLDNSVPKGEKPRTIAYGQNGSLVIEDICCFLDIDRFKNVFVDATRPEEIEKSPLADRDAAAFLRRAMKDLSRVDILVPGDEIVFCRAENGRVTLNPKALPADIPLEIFGHVSTTSQSLGRVKRQTGIELVGNRGAR